MRLTTMIIKKLTDFDITIEKKLDTMKKIKLRLSFALRYRIKSGGDCEGANRV